MIPRDGPPVWLDEHGSQLARKILAERPWIRAGFRALLGSGNTVKQLSLIGLTLLVVGLLWFVWPTPYTSYGLRWEKST